MSPAEGARVSGLEAHRHAFKLAQGKFPPRLAHELATHEREKLRSEAVAFIREVCFRRDATHYQLLNVPADARREAIKESYHLLMALIHPDRAEGAREAWPADWAQRANRAYAVLTDDGARASYDKGLRAFNAPPPSPRPAVRRRTRKAATFRRRLANTFLAVGTLAAIVIAIAWIDHSDEHFPFAAPPGGRDVAMGSERPRFLGTSVVPARDNMRDVLPAGSVPQSDKLLAPLWRDRVPSAAVEPQPARRATPGDATEPGLPLWAREAPAAAEAPSRPHIDLAQAADAVPSIVEARLTSGQIEILVARLIGYYEAGETDNLMALLDAKEAGFWQTARTRQAYFDFFRATRQRRLRVKNLDWQTASASARAQGQARVEAEYVDASGSLERDIEVEMEIALRNGEARITRLSLYPNAP